ncbi:Serine/threonine-protein kinase TOR [Camellia lanceoleosa]|uniref:Serine/threonine-protein kinase TOR n=1 Tax=Camellia lanceoleosa TaxID=1840588 RepID=A0ACC0HYR7_9ERIC|nr:Serine/threonine-protein kinase TOR [Camellia lanceoleosa]
MGERKKKALVRKHWVVQTGKVTKGLRKGEGGDNREGKVRRCGGKWTFIATKSPDAPWMVDGAGLPSNVYELLPKLAEFITHYEKPLPIDIRLLGALADEALHYKEMEFEGARSKKMDANPVAVVEALIHINSQLHQHEVFICLS